VTLRKPAPNGMIHQGEGRYIPRQTCRRREMNHAREQRFSIPGTFIRDQG
jgi:hypothetical protein